MREILFRGKRLADGKWIYGYYFEQEMHDGLRSYIRTSQTDRFGSDFSVDPDTVGEYTGLQDMNGKKIFEGDIVKCNNKVEEYIGIVDWDNCNPSMCIRYKSEKGFDRVEYDFIICGNMTLELLGNRWDNPELLKGGEK